MLPKAQQNHAPMLLLNLSNTGPWQKAWAYAHARTHTTTTRGLLLSIRNEGSPSGRHSLVPADTPQVQGRLKLPLYPYPVAGAALAWHRSSHQSLHYWQCWVFPVRLVVQCREQERDRKRKKDTPDIRTAKRAVACDTFLLNNPRWWGPVPPPLRSPPSDMYVYVQYYLIIDPRQGSFGQGDNKTTVSRRCSCSRILMGPFFAYRKKEGERRGRRSLKESFGASQNLEGAGKRTWECGKGAKTRKKFGSVAKKRC